MKRLVFLLLVAVASVDIALADEGMWMINGIDKALEKKMKQRGLKLPAKAIYDADAPGATLSDAVVSLDFGCTGSVISDEGLVITNHHCAYGDVHALSTDEKNYLEDGFWAMSREEEVPIPGKSIYFLKRVLDVTQEVQDMLADAQARGQKLGFRKLNYLVESKYSEETGLEASLASMWSGEKYYLMLYEVYSDIRIVAAPPVSFAAYGGDIDNWSWPQHKCDFALYRIYTGPDGCPANYSPDNIPLSSQHKLQVSTAGYRPGDYTMVIGYPGRTDRYSSSAKVDFEANVILPVSNRIRGEYMSILNRRMNQDPSVRLKYSDFYFGLSNFQELDCGKVRNIRRFDVVGLKAAQEAGLQAWIDADSQRQERWGDMLEQLRVKYKAVAKAEADANYYRETLVRGSAVSRLVSRVNLLRREVLASHGIKPRPAVSNLGPDSSEVWCCRQFRFCGGDFHAVQHNLLAEYERIDLDVEKELFCYAVREFYTGMDPTVLGPYQKALEKEYTGADGVCDYQALALYLWENSFLTDISRLKDFLSQEHCLQDYMSDPVYRFHQDIRIVDLNRKVSDIEGSPTIHELEREYTHALYRKSLEDGLAQYPNANSTMRITYGTVGGIEPYDGVSWSWRSTSEGIMEKYDPTTYEFGMSQRQKDLLEEGDWGRWAAKDSDRKQKMFVNFLTDCDITGGNSGSPVLNARGELIGLAFDGNMESLASDVYYVDDYTKCVCVDIRYVFWVLEKYAGMNHILEEVFR